MLDIQAMYWKELKDLFSQGNTQAILRLLLVAAVGIWIPIQSGYQWLQLPSIEIVILAFFPVLLIFSFVADVFAGERERHTLESLLATRLSDWSILAGKTAALLTLSCGMTIISTMLGLVVTNLMVQGHAWSFYPLDRFLLVLLLSLVLEGLAITIGILVSLRAATVRQAQQILSFGLIGLTTAISFLGTQIMNASIVQQLQKMGEVQALLLCAACIAIIDIFLIGLVLVRFQRSRLLFN